MKKPFYKRWWFIVIAIIIVLGIIGCIIPDSDVDEPVADQEIEQEVETTAAETTTAAPKVSVEFENALTKAQIYADTMYMSKDAIYDQLTSEYGEGFDEDAAQYAIENVEADWNKNALEKAKTYQNDMAMSKSAIYDQLVSDYGEQFTADQAQYAVDHLED